MQLFEVFGGVALGAGAAFFFRRLERFVGSELRLGFAAVLWCLAATCLSAPDLLNSYLAYRHEMPAVNWVTQGSAGACYDVLASPDGQRLFAAQGPVISYKFNSASAVRTHQTESLYAQRLALDADHGVIYAPARDESNQGKTDVYGFDINRWTSIQIRQPGCRMPLRIQFRPRQQKIYYTCEASGHTVEYAIADGSVRSLGKCNIPNHLQLGEQEDQLVVYPVLGPRILVYALPEGNLLRRVTAVPPIYGSAEDRRRHLWIMARFILGDLELRDDRTLEPVGNIRLDQGPRHLVIDRETGRVFTCSYFLGTLCIVDLEKRSVSRLFAGPRARGVYYDSATERLYFCSPLGLGFYEKADIQSAWRSHGFFGDLGELVDIIRDSSTPTRFLDYLSLLSTLAAQN